MRGRDSSLAFMTFGPALPPASGFDRRERGGHISPALATTKQINNANLEAGSITPLPAGLALLYCPSEYF